ncbi:uncharacterized protein F5147DRAFT_664986 [Suillus discolor]|uniref:Uncharacterized protein n=1 Tax=Suillus discolor TaxID=1912936 RepID=A0A9P7FK46_9AGAM|nr:uncharacterized protein F5147DRAFT_664986 [Suillus discolor]KAG2119637.1 hypothetical protein F5147DRAFT_664986 [Suillus discolor]
MVPLVFKTEAAIRLIKRTFGDTPDLLPLQKFVSSDPTFIDHIGEDSSGSRQTLALITATTDFDDTIDFLFPLDVLDEFNDRILDKLPGDFRKYCKKTLTMDSIHEANRLLFQFRQPQRSRAHSVQCTRKHSRLSRDVTHPRVPHRLDLKPNCICAIQRNLSVKKVLVRNGRVRMIALHRRIIEVQFLNTFESHCISRITFSFHPNCSSWTVNLRQFPLRPAYATTFSGCKGLTLARTVLDLRKDPFAHGQLYTALSRVRSSEREETRCVYLRRRTKDKTANIVFSDLLL